MDSSTTAHRANPAMLIAGILLIAACLRAPFTGVAPVLGSLRAEFSLGTAAAGALTTLPLLAFAVLSPFAGSFARQFGLERTLFAALVTIATGIALRSSGGVAFLYLGTAIVGLGIAVGNVLLPSLLKRDFPRDVASLTSIYAITMGVAAAIASAVAAPFAQAWGWRATLAAVALLPMVAALAWSPQLVARTEPLRATAAARGSSVWRSTLAWQVTLFFGLNSTVYYIAIGWLPTILVDRGFTATEAGSLHGLLQLATAAAGPLLWFTLKRMDHRVPTVASALCTAVGLIGILAAPSYAALWSILLGIGTGACVILGLTFVGLRTSSPSQSAALSGMAQSFGYGLAAIGPTAMGALHDALQGWRTPLVLCVGMAFAIAGLGALAARQRQIV